MPYIFEQILSCWLTTLTIVVNVIIWFCVNQFRVPTQAVSFNYRKIVVDGQWWRIVTSAFAHYSFLHILFNMFSLWSFRFLELAFGQLLYIQLTLLLLILSSLFTLLFYKCLIRFLKWDHYYEHVHAVGYSAVIFGLLTVGSWLNPKGSIDLLFGLKIPSLIVPFFYLVVSSLLFPQASFVGHLSGILAGLCERLIFSPWLYKIPYSIPLVVMSIGFFAAMAYSLKLHHRFFGGGANIDSSSSNNESSTMIGDRSIIGSVCPSISRLNPWRRGTAGSAGSSSSGTSSGFTMLNGMLVSRNVASSTHIGQSMGRTLGSSSSSGGATVSSPTNYDNGSMSAANQAGMAALARFNSSASGTSGNQVMASVPIPSAPVLANDESTSITINQPYTFVDLPPQHDDSEASSGVTTTSKPKNFIIHTNGNTGHASSGQVNVNTQPNQEGDSSFNVQYPDPSSFETDNQRLLQRDDKEDNRF